MRSVRHALRWIGLGALLAYLFDPDQGGARRTAIIDRAKALIGDAKGTARELERSADELAGAGATQAPTSPSAPSPVPGHRAEASAATG